MKKILLILLLLIPTFVLADDIEIQRIRLESRSENVNETMPPSYSKLTATLNNSFLGANQKITYKLTIINNGTEDYKLSYIETLYKTKCEIDLSDGIIKAGETKDVLISLESSPLEDVTTYNEDMVITIDAVKANSKVDKEKELIKTYVIAGVAFVLILVSLNLLKKWPIPMLLLLVAAIVGAAYAAKNYIVLTKEEKVTINSSINYNYKTN